MTAPAVRKVAPALRLLVGAGAVSLAIFAGSISAYGGQASLAWDANPDPAVAGYMVYYGQNSGNYSGKADAGKQASYTVNALLDGQKYYYAVTAYDLGRAESGFSNEASAAVAASGSTPVATPATGGTTGSGSGGGGGCSIGSTSNLDPTLPILILAAAIYFRRRQSSTVNFPVPATEP